MQKASYILRSAGWLTGILILLATVGRVFADEIVLKSGEVVEGRVLRTVGNEVTIRTAIGVSSYHVRELDQAWVDAHYDPIQTQVRQQRVDDIQGAIDLHQGLFGETKLQKAKPFLKQNVSIVLRVAGVLVAERLGNY